MASLAYIQERMAKLKDWGLEMNSIMKEFNFSSFSDALVFVNKVAEIAIKQEHHPEILLSFTTVRLTLTTHSEGTLTSKDFDVAEEIDKIVI